MAAIDFVNVLKEPYSRLSSCKTGVYNVRLLIILERGCSSMYIKKDRGSQGSETLKSRENIWQSNKDDTTLNYTIK